MTIIINEAQGVEVLVGNYELSLSSGGLKGHHFAKHEVLHDGVDLLCLPAIFATVAVFLPEKHNCISTIIL